MRSGFHQMRLTIKVKRPLKTQKLVGPNWRDLNFVRDFFQKNPRTSMMINMYDKKSKEVKTNYLKIEKDLQI